MRRAVAVIVAFAVVGFGAGWVASDSEQPANESSSKLVSFEPLPVPEVIILNGPWADARPKPVAVKPINLLAGGPVGRIIEYINRVLGVEVPRSRLVETRP